MPKSKAKSNRATDSMMELENLAETVSKHMRQGNCPKSVSPARKALGHPYACYRLILDATAPEMPAGVEAYPGNEQVLSFDIDTNPIPIAGVHNQLGLHISGMYIHMALLLETQPGEKSIWAGCGKEACRTGLESL
ncbi:hypothetical protein DPMN_038039 [Dreissena polymorpha]|uniref:Uncharacterized protein n=1 Tax=Dreissena polymorpha TaxID=45954 RepID=A0A9D4RMU6_DREPO|nr:hypothetical protein DPMN_038039 [Dreissena polymorpha]